MFLPVIEPVTSASSTDDPLQLVGLDPNDLIDTLVAPKQQTLAAELHSTTGDPQKDETLVLQHRNIQLPHLVVGQRAIRQFHMDIPWRIGHDY